MELLICYNFFLSPQAKRSVIITNKNRISRYFTNPCDLKREVSFICLTRTLAQKVKTKTLALDHQYEPCLKQKSQESSRSQENFHNVWDHSPLPPFPLLKYTFSQYYCRIPKNCYWAFPVRLVNPSYVGTFIQEHQFLHELWPTLSSVIVF